MTKRTIWHSFFAFSLLLFVADATAVELLNDDRMVRTIFDDGSNIFVPPAPFADFNQTSYQNTSVNENQFSGTGNGYGESDVTFFIAESTFDITFRATEISDIALDGSFFADNGTFGFAQVSVALYAGPNVVFSDSVFGNNEAAFAFNGVLATGVYRLIIQTDITPGGFDTVGGYIFAATFSPSSAADTDNDGKPGPVRQLHQRIQPAADRQQPGWNRQSV